MTNEGMALSINPEELEGLKKNLQQIDQMFVEWHENRPPSTEETIQAVAERILEERKNPYD